MVATADGRLIRSDPDGTSQEVERQPDPRFGMLAPLENAKTTLPVSGLERIVSTTATYVLANNADPLSVETKTDLQVVNGRASQVVYRASPGRTVTSTSPQGRLRTTTLDEKARVTSNVVPGLAETQLHYDERGRLVEAQTLGETIRTTQIAYQSDGWVDSVTDSLGRIIRFTYDQLGRVAEQTLPDGRVVAFTYDPQGNLTSVAPPGRPAHQFAFSPVNLVTGYDAPDAADGPGVTTYDYNLAKQLVAVNRPDGVTVNYFYEGDAALGTVNNPNTGRLKVIRQPRGDTSFGYDTAGRLSTITAPDGGKLTYDYDGSLLLSTTWSNGAVNGSVSRTYNTRTFVENGVTKTGSDFWVASESVNGANTVNFTYDLDGLLTGANTTVNGSAVNFTINRDAQNGLITGSSIGGVSDSISYNGFAEPIGYAATFNGSSLYYVSYVRDAIGRISSKTETVNGVTTTYGYHYDLAGRLTGVDKNGVPSSSYTYDSNGNRLSYSGELGSFTGTYDAQDRLLSYGNFVYEYTANGELRRKENVVTGEVWEYGYDAFHNLMSAKTPNGDVVEYAIDGDEKRIAKKVNGSFSSGWIYGYNGSIIAEMDANGSVVSRFVGGYMVKGGQTYRLVRDHLGSIRMVVNVASGAVAQQVEYDEFGNIIYDSNPGFQPFGFAGGLYDQHTTLTRFGARDYDPQSGRWTAKDPLNFGGGDLNLYGYATNDPINFFDRSGLTTWPADGRVTSEYGDVDSVRNNDPHTGIDIANPMGGEVVASDDGTVISTTPSPNGANQVIVQNDDGSVSGYAHVDPSVKPGQKVKEGEPIGNTDTSGRSTGPHVHYTWRPGPGQPRQDPRNHLPPRGPGGPSGGPGGKGTPDGGPCP